MPPPRWLGWAVGLGVGSVILGVAVGAILLTHGLADPPLAGPLMWEDAALDWASSPALAPGEGGWSPAPALLPDRPFTLVIRARLSGDSDPGAAWGVWVETVGGDRVLYAISGELYTTTRRCPAAPPPVEIEACPAVRPDWRWMSYNRLKPPGKSNQITLHAESPGKIRLRLNDEKMGITPLDLTGRWGLWARGGRDSGAQIDWEWAGVYARE